MILQSRQILQYRASKIIDNIEQIKSNNTELAKRNNIASVYKTIQNQQKNNTNKKI